MLLPPLALSCAVVAPLTVPRLWLLGQGDVWRVPAWAGCPSVPTPEGEKPFGVALGGSIPMGSSGDHHGHGTSVSSGFMQGGRGWPESVTPCHGRLLLSPGSGGQGKPWQRGEHLKQSPLCPAEHPSLSLGPRQDAVATM